jgi:hypothetical protein
MAQTAIGPNINQAFDIASHLAPQITFHLIDGLDGVRQATDFLIRQIFGPFVEVDLRLSQEFAR